MEGKIALQLQELLKKKIGLDASTLGSTAIVEKAVSDRMKHCGIFDVASYLIHLQTSSQEWDALIEKVIVPETWFFRDREAFNFLSHYIISEWLPNQSFQRLRVLSVPCSTGEEPYSIAMILLEAGLNPNQFQIDAVDISKMSLQKAQRAMYGPHSFRGQVFASPGDRGLVLRKRYFDKNAESYQLCPQVKKTVNLIWGNLIDPFLANKLSESYHIIFCRNLLIYFDRKSREKAMKVIQRLLIPNGLLFLGSAETNNVWIEKEFLSVRYPMSFAYRKRERKISKLTKLERREQRPKPRPLRDSISLRRYGNKSEKKIIQLTSHKCKGNLTNFEAELPKQPQENIHQHPSDYSLENARKLADRGKLQEAAHLCQTYITQNPTNVTAYVLLGEVYQAGGNDDRAEQYFQKAIYLDPKHYEALMHLTFLKEQRGDLSNAAILRKRIQRLDLK